MTNLLSNPVLDELYSIRRILVNRHNAVLKIKDEFGIAYYDNKVKAMDEAISSFIEANKVPVEYTEQTMLEKARSALDMRPRIPGGEQG